MPSKYWIKLYQEILQDPKMGRLPDNLWRRTIELFLLAGELGSDLKDNDPNRGHLPPTGEIAWHLRQPEDKLQAELSELAQVGILIQTDAGWLVANFAKRQQHIEPAERMKQYRERKREKELQSSDASDTELVTRIVTGRNTEIEEEIESNGVGKRPPPANTFSPGSSEAGGKLKQEMVFKLSQVCKINLKVASGKQKGQLGVMAESLIKIGAVPLQLDKFSAWWYANDWRGLKGQAPEPQQVGEEWDRFKDPSQDKKLRITAL